MRKLWWLFGGVIVVTFGVLIWLGSQIYHEAPPIPVRVLSTTGQTVIAENDITAGQNVWQATGGMELGSVWGHGSYVAPDWSADWLHREAMYILDKWAHDVGSADYTALAPEVQSQFQRRLTDLVRRNTYDASSHNLVVDPVVAEAIESLTAYYSKLFLEGNSAYALPANAVTDPVKARQLSAFFYWSAWAASTNRPGQDISYTSNWPHEELVGNRPTGDNVVWTGVSIIVLLAGIGGMSWWYSGQKHEIPLGEVPATDPLLGSVSTPSQRATIKYFWVVSGLILLQILMGVVTAHYGVEGGGLYGIPLDKILPYSVARTWHTQLGIFWIATAWLAAGLYIGPAVGYEPKGQRLGVNILFGALLVVVLGSMAGEWMSVMNKIHDQNLWFYFGHSGYEYIDLGRGFQIGLFVGLLLWLFLVARSIWPALRRKDEQQAILTLFTISAIAIAGFYGAALAYGKHTNLAITEYWRWWVVHLWVEGFFEVFATVVIAFLFARLKLLSLRSAAQQTVLASTIFLSGGIIGTAHHLYFSGTPTVVLAFGSIFSALEVVPLMFVGYEAWQNLRLSKLTPWIRNYKWPIYYFVAVAFWNMVGAGLFGFMINPPIALYYMQGLNTTPVHAHAALFGVYGMLGIGLMLFALRAMMPHRPWKEPLIRFSFWATNIGLFCMVVFSLLPVGLRQTWASVNYGYWYARSSEFLQTDVMQILRWMRVPGDTIFAVGSISLVVFIVGLATGRSYRSSRETMAVEELEDEMRLR